MSCYRKYRYIYTYCMYVHCMVGGKKDKEREVGREIGQVS